MAPTTLTASSTTFSRAELRDGTGFTSPATVARGSHFPVEGWGCGLGVPETMSFIVEGPEQGRVAGVALGQPQPDGSFKADFYIQPDAGPGTAQVRGNCFYGDAVAPLASPRDFIIIDDLEPPRELRLSERLGGHAPAGAAVQAAGSGCRRWGPLKDTPMKAAIIYVYDNQNYFSFRFPVSQDGDWSGTFKLPLETSDDVAVLVQCAGDEAGMKALSRVPMGAQLLPPTSYTIRRNN